MAMVSQLKNMVKGFSAANRREDRRGDLPHGADHPGHRVIYMEPT
jgi:hypothetical protein